MQTVNKAVKFRNTHEIHNILSTEYIKAILHHGVFDIHMLKPDAHHYVRTQNRPPCHLNSFHPLQQVNYCVIRYINMKRL